MSQPRAFKLPQESTQARPLAAPPAPSPSPAPSPAPATLPPCHPPAMPPALASPACHCPPAACGARRPPALCPRPPSPAATLQAAAAIRPAAACGPLPPSRYKRLTEIVLDPGSSPGGRIVFIKSHPHPTPLSMSILRLLHGGTGIPSFPATICHLPLVPSHIPAPRLPPPCHPPI
jgi:hypothetical protein